MINAIKGRIQPQTELPMCDLFGSGNDLKVAMNLKIKFLGI